jgi:hypothetical protein
MLGFKVLINNTIIHDEKTFHLQALQIIKYVFVSFYVLFRFNIFMK